MLGITFRHLKASTVVGLTDIGKRKAEAYAGNDVRDEVLSTLNEHGRPMSVRELADDMHVPTEKVGRIAHQLMKQGYIRQAGDMF